MIHETAVVGGPAQWRGKDETALRYPPEIAPTAYVGPLTQIDAGCERPTIIGPETMVMGMVHVGHGVQIGAHCDIATGTVLAGEVTVGDHVRIGVGAVVIPYRVIGDGARIGAGAVVTKDVPAFECWAGNPAKKLYDLCKCGARSGKCECGVPTPTPLVTAARTAPSSATSEGLVTFVNGYPVNA